MVEVGKKRRVGLGQRGWAHVGKLRSVQTSRIDQCFSFLKPPIVSLSRIWSLLESAHPICQIYVTSSSFDNWFSSSPVSQPVALLQSWACNVVREKVVSDTQLYVLIYLFSHLYTYFHHYISHCKMLQYWQHLLTLSSLCARYRPILTVQQLKTHIQTNPPQWFTLMSYITAKVNVRFRPYTLASIVSLAVPNSYSLFLQAHCFLPCPPASRHRFHLIDTYFPLFNRYIDVGSSDQWIVPAGWRGIDKCACNYSPPLFFAPLFTWNSWRLPSLSFALAVHIDSKPWLSFELYLNVCTCTTFGVLFVLVMPNAIRANATVLAAAQNLISRDVYPLRSNVCARWW